ncbi:MAG TPA: hypothetical protein VJU84_00895 [Pyrinomonadaceae bacterium]|nr:hypothetical protein [Pyrinomonadaceae bacterium]
MRTNIENSSWNAKLAAFGTRNHLRPTRLEVLGADRNIDSDFWLEDGLLLAGIDLDTKGERGPSVEIMLRVSKTPSLDHMTHSVTEVKRIAVDTDNSQDQGLEIEDAKGTITIMHFES